LLWPCLHSPCRPSLTRARGAWAWQSVGVLGEAGASAEYRVGTNALAVHSEGLRVSPVVQDGVVADWDGCEALLRHAYTKCLACKPE
jgi:hypothetical protein